MTTKHLLMIALAAALASLVCATVDLSPEAEAQSPMYSTQLGPGSQLPVGAILAWHRDLMGAPLLPPEWRECNGQVVADPTSPLAGVQLPDLNSSVAGNGGRFLRGAPTSGVMQDHQFQDHGHSTNQPPAGMAAWSCSEAQGGACGGTSQLQFQVNGANSGNRGNETRPMNMSVIWIIKVK